MKSLPRVNIFASLLAVALLLAASLSGWGQQAAYAASYKSDSPIGLTPPMGYSTWNAVRFNVSDALIREIADSMVRTGLRDLGYMYVNIDDGWQGGRDADGNFYPDPVKFPHGMKELADYVHSKGLKIGIYTDLGKVGCGGRIGSYGHYQQDVNQFAEWGYDYIKVDACGADSMGLDFKTYYEQFGEALKNANPKRDILYNICEWGKQQPWNWAPAIGHTWRVGYDIDNQGDYWNGVLYEIDQASPHADVAGPGHFNDPDSLEVGVIADKYPGQKSLSYEESVSNFSMWAVLAAPLMLGLDVATLDAADSYSSKFADIIKNAEVIAVDQDPAGFQGRLADESTPGLQVYSKPLGSHTSGERAVVLLNRTNEPAKMSVTSEQIGLKHSFLVRDLWKHEDMGRYVYSYSDTVPAHGSVMLKISGIYNSEQPQEQPDVVYEAESSVNALTGETRTRAVPEASGGLVVGFVGNGGANSLQFNNITVPASGTYRVTISHISTDTRTAELYVNGKLYTKLSLAPSGGWSTVRTSIVYVDLNAGANTLKFSNSTADMYTPDFDKLEVSALPIAYEIAGGKPATATSEGLSFPATNGNDGSMDTRWSASDAEPGHSWTVDLGGRYLMKSSSVSFEDSSKVYKYKIEVRDESSDHWTTAVDRTDHSEAGAVIRDIVGSVGRYAKITVTGLPDANTKASFWEFKLFGEAVEEDGAITELIGPGKVAAGDEFNVNLALGGNIRNVFAQDISIDYDSGKMEFVAASSLIEGVQIVKTITSMPGKVRLILASLGYEHAVNGDSELLKLSFRAKEAAEPTVGEIEVIRAVLGDDRGVETEAAPSSIRIEVTPVEQGIPGDLNGDGKVSIGDLAIVAAHYGKDTSNPDWEQVKKADVHKDGVIDIYDLAAVAKLIVES